ncbi:NlpC/P60 family protein [Kaistia dalseonensis]|uniref:Cell wall-associated NlpC family hydrolase n=1 Tax=Kaistia dalseonensis TaxID=410840 RepID=A0ABU0HBN5_9HYPH|nr:NlpC/P60 family protein [Kaistia dalseonensis]MCX5496308.1 NlpC/P60 family protein [Kaistia dalseonensis]MDQ0438926.1 cell wall-associated NlpC family hydrolase [Kaistia dalseonensis]
MSESLTLDRRTHAFRPDLADAALEGRVVADRFVEGAPRRIAIPSTPIRRAPRSDAAIDSEALRGERVKVFEETMEGWAWAQLETDGYVGFIASDALGADDPAPTHRVTALRTFVYPAADLRLPPVAALSLGSEISLGREVETRGMLYRLLADGSGAVIARHVAPMGAAAEPDFVTVAERFLNVPYLWGGRTSLGLDCSALVQLALAAAGIAAPRDSDQQAAGLGQPVEGGLSAELIRGDLIFWPGHVGMLRDAETLLHASGYQMMVVSEPLAEATARIAASTGHQPSIIRRIG